MGTEIDIKATIAMGDLKPEDVCVEIYHGYVNTENKIVNGAIKEMDYTDFNKEKKIYTFSGRFPCQTSGLYGYTVRIVPKNEKLSYPHETGLILWAER